MLVLSLYFTFRVIDHVLSRLVIIIYIDCINISLKYSKPKIQLSLLYTSVYTQKLAVRVSIFPFFVDTIQSNTLSRLFSFNLTNFVLVLWSGPAFPLGPMDVFFHQDVHVCMPYGPLVSKLRQISVLFDNGSYIFTVIVPPFILN